MRGTTLGLFLFGYFLLTECTLQTDQVAVTSIPYGDTEWYSLSVPKGDKNILDFFGIDFDASDFIPSSAPYGLPDPQTRWECPLNRPAFLAESSLGLWKANQNLLLRRLIDLPAGTSSLEIKITAFQSVAVYVNEQAVSGGGDNPLVTPGGLCAAQDNIILTVPERYLRTGTNLIAVQVVGGIELNYFDLQLKAVFPRPTGERGTVYTWGKGYYGVLGNGDDSDSFVPSQILQLKEIQSDSIKQLSLGVAHTLLLTGSGRVYSWGKGKDGQLGMEEDESEVALLVPGLPLGQVTAIAAGSLHNLILDSKGRIYCFGQNIYMQCGLGKDNRTNIFDSTKIPSFSSQNIIFIGAKDTHSAAMTSDFSLYVWGRGIDESAKFVGIVPNIISISVGSHHVLLLDQNGNVYSYGENTVGQLGLGADVESVSKPTLIESLRGLKIVDIQAGTDNSFAITDSGKVFVWGGGAFGKNGIGAWASQETPVQLIALSSVVVRKVGAGVISTIFLTDGGQVLYSGANLRDGSHSLTPQFWASASDKYFVNVFASYLHFAAVTLPSLWKWTRVGEFYEGVLSN